MASPGDFLHSLAMALACHSELQEQSKDSESHDTGGSADVGIDEDGGQVPTEQDAPPDEPYARQDHSLAALTIDVH